MRAILALLVVLSASSFALAQPAKPALPKTPEQLLPADATAYFRYDGYVPHRKAYDQTAVAMAMKEGLGDFFDHGFDQLFTLANGGAAGNPEQDAERRRTVDRFLDCLWRHGFAAGVEFAPRKKGQPSAEDLAELTIVFPQGAEKKNRQAIEKFLHLGAEALNAEVTAVTTGGRAGNTFPLGAVQVTWWPEGEHLLLTIGTQPMERSLQVPDGRRPNLASATWFPHLTGFNRYETDMRGYVNLDAVVKKMATVGLEETGLGSLKERLARQVVLAHLGLNGLKDLTFHLGFEGKYQRSTVRLGVVEAHRRSGLLHLFTGPATFDPAKLPPLPPDADYVSTRHLNWEEAYDYLRISYGLLAISQVFKGEMPERFPDLDDLLKIDFRRDFLQQLDTTLVSWGAHSEGPFFLGQGFAVKVKDAGKVRKSLQAIATALKDKEMFAPEKKMYRGQEMYVLAKSPVPVSFTVHNDWMLVGLYPQPVQGVILRSGGKYRTWKAPPELAVAFAKEPKDKRDGKLIFGNVSDPRPAITIGLSLLPVLNTMAGGKLLDPDKIPNSQAINEWLFPNVGLCYDDGNALRWENLYSINEPDDLLVVQVVPLAVQMVPFRVYPPAAKAMPAPAAARGEMVAPPRKVDPKEPTRGTAKAIEKDGGVRITLSVREQIPYEVTRKVPYTVTENIVVDGKIKAVMRTAYKEVKETLVKELLRSELLIAEGKKVQVTRKDGKAIDPKMLPALLKMETPVVIVRGSAMDAAFLEKLDERTLIIRIVP